MNQVASFLDTFSPIDYAQGVLCVLLLALTVASLFWFAPFRSNLEQAQRRALYKLKDDGDIELSINADGSLRKIPLATDGDIDLAKFRASAKKYITYIDALNKQLRSLLARDALMFLILTWIFATASTLTLLNILTRNVATEPVSLIQFVRDMNANALGAYLQAPPIPVDPIAESELDRLAIVPYSLLTKFLLSGLAMFLFKYGFLLRPKFGRTRTMLKHLLAMRSDDDLAVQLRKMRQMRDQKTEVPWFKLGSTKSAPDAGFSRGRGIRQSLGSGATVRIFVRYKSGSLVPNCYVSIWYHGPIPNEEWMAGQTNSNGYADFSIPYGWYITTIYVGHGGGLAWKGSQKIYDNTQITVIYPE